MISCTSQVFSSGTAIGTLARAAEFAKSSSDFINKLHISLKECNETIYWLELFKEFNLISE